MGRISKQSREFPVPLIKSATFSIYICVGPPTLVTLSKTLLKITTSRQCNQMYKISTCILASCALLRRVVSSFFKKEMPVCCALRAGYFLVLCVQKLHAWIEKNDSSHLKALLFFFYVCHHITVRPSPATIPYSRLPISVPPCMKSWCVLHLMLPLDFSTTCATGRIVRLYVFLCGEC